MGLKGQLNITYVCSGNTCRSYMAEAISKHLLESEYLKNRKTTLSKINISSSGTFTILKTIPKSSKIALDKIGVPAIESNPSPVDGNQLRNSDLVLTMADTHRSAIIKNFKNIDQKKIYTLLELSNLILYLESEKIYRVRPKYQLNTPKPRTLQDLKNKIYVLKHINREILLTTDQLDIQDPFGRSAATYLQVAKKIKDNIIIVFNYLFDTKLNRGKQDG
ncbi:MAG: hypothetical protein PHN32_05855 [Actinomycetota bacterium]|nr:hypothetical protein [Actinomycetota bacterium]